MRYRYGDSSAFPLNDNFIDTLSAATDTCVALLAADGDRLRAQSTADSAAAVAAAEIADLDALEARMVAALGGRDQLSLASEKMVLQVIDDAKRAFGSARQRVTAWCESERMKTSGRCAPASVLGPLHHLLVAHELPYTSWGLRWKAGHGDEAAQAQVYAVMQRGLSATLAVTIPDDHRWAEPVKISVFDPRLVLQLRRKGFLSGERLRDEDLTRYYVTRVTHTAEREALVLGRRAKQSSEGLRISLREGDDERVTVVRVDERETPVSEPVVLDGIELIAVRRLWARVEETILDLVDCRSHLLQAQLYGKSVNELETPEMVALAIIQCLAPIVKEMVRHGLTPNELSLERDLGDGRREELFVAHRDIVRKYSRLPAEQRALFDAFGLDVHLADGGARSSQQPSSARAPSSYPSPTVPVMTATLPPGAQSPLAKTAPLPPPSPPAISARASRPFLLTPPEAPPPPPPVPPSASIVVLPTPHLPKRRTAPTPQSAASRPIALPTPTAPPKRRKSNPSVNAAS